MIIVFFAHGFEEIEGITAVDVLRRGDVEVKTVGIGSKTVTGAHGVTIHCDMQESEVNVNKIKGIVLPGGMPGTTNLDKSNTVHKAIDYCVQNNLTIGAICAAPMILGERGLLDGRTATIFPGMEEHLKGATYENRKAIVDGNFVTGNGPASATAFALKVLEQLTDEETASKVAEGMQCGTQA